MKNKVPKPKILSVTRSDTAIIIRRQVHSSSEQKTTPDPKAPGKTETKVVSSSREYTEKSHEAPLPAFDEALQKLSGLVCNVLETGADWKKGIAIVGIALTYTETGVRSVVVSFTKAISATEGGIHPMKTPAIQIDDGKKTADGRRQCAKGHAEDVVDFIKQAQRYSDGERSQQLLDFEDEGEEDGDDDKIEHLPGMAGGSDN